MWYVSCDRFSQVSSSLPVQSRRLRTAFSMKPFVSGWCGVFASSSHSKALHYFTNAFEPSVQVLPRFWCGGKNHCRAARVSPPLSDILAAIQWSNPEPRAPSCVQVLTHFRCWVFCGLPKWDLLTFWVQWDCQGVLGFPDPAIVFSVKFALLTLRFFSGNGRTDCAHLSGLEPLALFFPVSFFASPGSSSSRIGCIRGLASPPLVE